MLRPKIDYRCINHESGRSPAADLWVCWQTPAGGVQSSHNSSWVTAEPSFAGAPESLRVSASWRSGPRAPSGGAPADAAEDRRRGGVELGNLARPLQAKRPPGSRGGEGVERPDGLGDEPDQLAPPHCTPDLTPTSGAHFLHPRRRREHAEGGTAT